MKKDKLVISLNIELKEEMIIWEQLKPYLDNIKIKEKYELKFRKIGKKLYLDLISMDKNPYKEILKCLLDTCEFDLSLKSGFDATQLLKEISKGEKKIESDDSSFFILLKTSKNISDILQLFCETSKEVNFNNKNINQINNFNIKYLQNKNCFEFTSEQISKYRSEFYGLYKYLKGFIIGSLKPLVNSFQMKKEEIVEMNLDNIKLLFYIPEGKNGLSICLKINKITEVMGQLLN